MSAHTPGPWRFWEGSHTKRYSVAAERFHKGGPSIHGNAGAIATLPNSKYHSTEANARLIAAAPELLEAGAALDAAMDMQEKRETGAFHLSMPAARHVWEEARAKWAAAIAKATGAA